MAPLGGGTGNPAPPPGLESEADAASASTSSGYQYSSIVQDIRKSMLEDVEKKIAQKGTLFPYEDVRRAVLQDVDARMAEKVDTLWKKGQQTVKAFQQKSSQKNQALLEELSACRSKQDSMEEEHAKLKAICHQLASRFHQLQLTSMSQNPEEAAAVAAAVAAIQPMIQGADSADPQTPPQDRPTNDFMPPFTSMSDSRVESSSAATAAQLPELPAFPFSSHSTDTGYPVGSPVATLKLADALDTEAPKAPLSLAQTLPGLKSPTPSQPKSQGSPNSSSDASATTSTNDKSFRFSFTLRKADGASLGLDVSHNNNTKNLHVENVLPGGAVDAWNRLCGNGQPERAVLKGDRIVLVNQVSGCGKKMLEECKNNQLLRLTLVRGKCPEDDEDPQAAATGTPKSSGLNPSVPAFEPLPKSSTPAAAKTQPRTPPTSEVRNGAGFSFNAEAKAFVPA